MSLRNIQKKLVHGTLIDVEILTSPVPQVIAQPGQDLDTDALPVAVQALPKWSKMFPCVSATSTKFGAWGPNRSWNIDFSTLLCICLTWPSYQVPMLHPWVCQHLPSDLKMFLCVSATSTKFGAWGPIRCWDIDSHSPMYLLNLALILGTDAPSMGVPTPPKWFKCFYASQKHPKITWCMGPY